MTAIKVLLFNVVLVAVARARTSVNVETEDAIKYLHKYGYLDDAYVANLKSNASVVRDAVSLFQDYYRLPGDGIMNEETKSCMRQTRCGVRDIPQRIVNQHVWHRWPKKQLTWNFLFGQPSVMETAREAFHIWASHSALTFTHDKHDQNPDILISFQQLVHPNMNARNVRICDSPFDGSGEAVAHATLPNGSPDFAEEIHIDYEETWHVTVRQNPPDKLSLLDVLVHEIGHALGLDHNSRNDSVMFPFLRRKAFPIRLSIDDILNIQNLYGSKDDASTERALTTTTTMMTPIVPPSPPLPNMDLCALKYIDVILIANHRMYVIYKKYIWSVSLDGRSFSKPMLVTDYLTFLPKNFTRITAAYQRPSGDIILIANNLFYCIENPKLTLRTGWPKNGTTFHLPPNAEINTAINTNTGRTFVIYNNSSIAEIDERYMLVAKYSSLDETFPGIPSTVTSAFRYIDGNLYFLGKKGRTYYVFNEFTNTMTKAGNFDTTIVNVACPTDGLLQQIQNLLHRLATVHNLFHKEEDDDDDDDDGRI